MRIIEAVPDMRAARQEMAGSVALIPTMGALHAGHEALLDRGRSAGGTLVASLFVNPAQFAPDEDFSTYPRDRNRDLEIFKAHGVDAVFAPSVEQMYPAGEATRVDPGPLGSVLEGAFRPGHFTGVATVVAKLFTVIRPDIAIFGEKDAQQLRIIRQLNDDLLFGTRIIGVPTVREPDGLALSSRNAYLKGESRRAALVLFRALQDARRAWKDGVTDARLLRERMGAVFGAEPRARLDYASVADPRTLQELERIEGAALVSVACRIDGVRLIDNIMLQP